MFIPKKIQKKYKLITKAKKRFGQNFLVDKNVINKIIQIAQIQGKDVVEVGPGTGSLTTFLIDLSKTLIAYEIDTDIAKALISEFKNVNFKLINGDFLKQTLYWKKKKIFVSNLPYYITSDILFKLFENSDKFYKAIVMVQNEVADRLSASVGSKKYGKLTISANYFAYIKKEFIVKPNSFLPPPKVNSAVVTLTFKDVDKKNNILFLDFIKKSFSMRRKTLFNNWKKIISPVEAKQLIKKLKLKASVRPQELTLAQFKYAFKILQTK